MTEDSERTDGQDPMEESFDQLRLSATRLHMVHEEGRRHVGSIDTGNAETNALVQNMLSELFERTGQLADDTDRTVEHFHPLYQADKRAGRAGPDRDRNDES